MQERPAVIVIIAALIFGALVLAVWRDIPHLQGIAAAALVWALHAAFGDKS